MQKKIFPVASGVALCFLAAIVLQMTMLSHRTTAADSQAGLLIPSGQEALVPEEQDLLIPSGLIIDNVYTGKSEAVLRKNVPFELIREDAPNIVFVYDGSDMEYIDPTLIDFWQMYYTFLDEGWITYETSIPDMYVMVAPDNTFELYLYYSTETSPSMPQMISL